MKKRLLIFFNAVLMFTGVHGVNQLSTEGSMDQQVDNPEHPDVMHIITLGQSLSMGYIATPLCNDVESEQALMFKRVRTQDFGYIYGISKAEYAANQEQYDNDFYASFVKLTEAGGYGAGKAWESASPKEYETPCAGIAEGLYNAFKEEGRNDIPFKVLFTAPGIGGTVIPGPYAAGERIFERCIKDVQKAKALCDSLGLTYKVSHIVWMQGEGNGATSIASYSSELANLMNLYNTRIKCITGQEDDVEVVNYQTTLNKGINGTQTQYPAIAQFQLAENNPLIHMGAPIYNLEFAADNVHLTGLSSRMIGNSMGRIIYRLFKKTYTLFKPVETRISGNTLVLIFDRDIVFDADNLTANGHDISEIATNAGFFAKDSEGHDVISSVTLGADERSIVIECSTRPTTLYYGFNEPDSYTLGGFVREKEQSAAYLENKLNVYMPVQVIDIQDMKE